MKLYITFLFVGFFYCSCGGGITTGGNSNTEITCSDGTKRIQANCTSVTSLKERVANANLGIPRWGLGFGGQYEERALGQIQESTQHLAVSLESKCRQFNACAISAEEWSIAEANILSQLNRHVELSNQLENDNADAQTGDALYTNAVPEQANLRLSVAYSLEFVQDVKGKYAKHTSGTPLASGSKFRIYIRTNQQAFAYILLLSSQGEATTLFPMRGIRLLNPLPGNTDIFIPDTNSGVFSLDEVTGVEHLQVIVSVEPLNDLENRLELLQSESNNHRDSVPLLQTIGNLLCDGKDEARKRGINLEPSAVDCGGVTTRGINLVPLSNTESTGIDQLVTRPYDNLLIKQHEIKHVARADSN